MRNYNMLYEKAIQVTLVQNELYYRRMTPIYTISTKKKEATSKSFANKAKEYFVVYLQTASFHGFGHLVAPGRHPLEIILWLVFLGLSIFGSVFLSSSTLARYQHSPAVVSMDRDMLAWNTSFPAATVCPSPGIDQQLLKVYVRDSPEPDKEMLEQFIKALANSSYINFESIPLYDGIPSDHFMDLILNLSVSFKPTLAVGDTGAILTMQPTITEMGLCYTINSEVAIYNSPKYRAENRWDTAINSNVTTLLVHPLDGDVFLLISNMSSSFTACIHGPLEVPDIANTKCYFALDGFYLKLYVTAFTIYTSAEAAKLSVLQRKCRFSHENNLEHNSIYSYNMCRMECRIRFALQHCECIPHFYRRIGDEKVCDVAGLHCLGRHKVELLTLKFSPTDPVTCDCLPICDDVNYAIQSKVHQKWSLSGTQLQWGINTYPRMRFRRDIIFGFTDLLVAVGSMAALFLGCSVLSFLEIIYFLTLRLFFYINGWK
ncbi:pickpocket protein 28-like [Plutella xylostella]|uniref:pickpocket protein 28-like n=1 Tax=Plutella xylostella TaxID=51655 RepID=UPI002032D366|nr:pickpocket protein 28-like [Plutella xylostella]